VLYPVRLSVRPSGGFDLLSESRRNFKFGGDLTPDTINRENKFQVYVSKVRVTDNKTSFFAHIIVKIGPIYIKLRPWAHSTHIVKYISPAETHHIFDIFPSVCLSVTALSFTRSWNAVYGLHFMGILPLTRLNG